MKKQFGRGYHEQSNKRQFREFIIFAVRRQRFQLWHRFLFFGPKLGFDSQLGLLLNQAAQVVRQQLPAQKKAWGALTGSWVPHDTRDEVVDYVNRWSKQAEVFKCRLLAWVAGRQVPRLAEALRQGQRAQRPGAPRSLAGNLGTTGHPGLRKAVSLGRLSSANLHDAGSRCGGRQSQQRLSGAQAGWQIGLVNSRSLGTGFQQPVKAHDHWHVDISHVNIAGTFYYLCSVLDGYSRAIVHWEIREQMKEIDVETIVQRAKGGFAIIVGALGKNPPPFLY